MINFSLSNILFSDPLFDLLLDLATSHGPESAAANDGSHLTAVACACLLSLVVVRGDTGRLLAAIAALLMSPRALAIQNIQVSYHRCNHSVDLLRDIVHIIKFNFLYFRCHVF